MPIATAILAAALLSGPAPADQSPMAAKEPLSPGKQIAAMAMNHPEEPDFVASKALEILDKGAKVGPYFSPDDASDAQGMGGPAAGGPQNMGPAANGPENAGQAGAAPQDAGQAAEGQNADGQAVGDQAAGAPQGAGQAGDNQGPAGQEPGETSGFMPLGNGGMFTMPAKSNSSDDNSGDNSGDNAQNAPRDIFLHPSAQKPTYAKLSGDQLTGAPAGRQKEEDDEAADAWLRPAKATTGAKSVIRAKGKARPRSADPFSMPGWG
ncbi:hypothetical protein AB0C10_31990 [Microbispora amethystogenes]|uniref:hypothetical protein n=1 Tax=Microbispora amethystogenes TaxID=1427754 RepID=UPI0033F0475D